MVGWAVPLVLVLVSDRITIELWIDNNLSRTHSPKGFVIGFGEFQSAQEFDEFLSSQEFDGDLLSNCVLENFLFWYYFCLLSLRNCWQRAPGASRRHFCARILFLIFVRLFYLCSHLLRKCSRLYFILFSILSFS